MVSSQSIAHNSEFNATSLSNTYCRESNATVVRVTPTVVSVTPTVVSVVPL
jgi:hypothetical protein